MRPLSDIAAQWDAVDRLLDEALALPPQARAAWLASLSGENLRHREALHDLLTTQERIETGSFLHAMPSMPEALLAPRSPTTEPQPGEVIGPWRLMRELGRGGMGLVWLAERADGLAARRVALKLPRLAWGQAVAERLALEREILAGLEHEHIARLYDAGVDQHGRPYIAMQYVEGEPIDAYARQRGLGIAARIELLLQAMSAVAHAHARLVVHRDLKPGNVLVSADGRVSLLDFGVAKMLDGERTRNSALTELTGRALTPDYASPEQIRGEPLGTANDVYSLGVLAYELLAGSKPYRLTRGTAAELEDAITQAEPPRASEAAATPARRKALRGDLDAILAKALKKPVEARYPGVDAFAQDLRRHLQGEPVQARPDGAGYRLAKFVGRHRLAVAMGSALTTSVLVGSVVSLWQAREAREQERRATLEVQRQRAIQDIYTETLSRLSALGADRPDELARPGAVTTVLLDKLREMAPRVAQRPDERGAQLEAVMVQLNYDNRFEESLAVGQDYLAHLRQHGAPPARVIDAYTTLGRTLFRLRRYDASEAMRRAGLDWAADTHDRGTELARMHIANDLGGLLSARGRRHEALEVLERADGIATRYFAAEHLRHVTLTRLAIHHMGFDDAQALELMRQAKAELQADVTADPNTVAHVDWQLGDALRAVGRAADAEAVLADSLEILRREYGRESEYAVRAFGRMVAAVARRDPPRSMSLLGQERQVLASRAEGLLPQAELLLRAREYEAAWLAGDTAAAARLAPPDLSALLQPDAMRDHDLLLVYAARTRLQAGDVGAALQVLEPLRRRWPDGLVMTPQSLRLAQALAEAELAAGREADALHGADELTALIKQAGGETGQAQRMALSVAALAAARLGDREAARERLSRLARQTLPPFASAAERADCELRRAEAMASMGQSDEAAVIARDLLPALVTTQQRDSPRLLLARRLAGVGA